VKKSSLAKIILFFVVPATAFLVLVEGYWHLVRGFHPMMEGPEGDAPAQVVNAAWSLFWISLCFVGVWYAGWLLSPERALRRNRPVMPDLLRDLIRYGLLLFSVAVVLRIVWGQDVTPLIGALGVGGIVLGLALQETLSNFFAGLALLAERPFAPGDWIRIGEKDEGQVEHITWRATKIRTRDNDYQILPNSMVAKEVVLNFRQPDEKHAIRLIIGASYKDAPDRVKKALLDVLAKTPGVLQDPPPRVHLKSYGDFAINYEIKCYITDYFLRPVIEDTVMHRIWYGFRRAGIEIPFPTNVNYEYKVDAPPPAQEEASSTEEALGKIPLFESLTADERKKLAGGSTRVEFAAGESVIRQGQPGNSLYCILAGAVQVLVRSQDGAERSVARLGEGDVFGEMSLLTGEPRSASVVSEDGVILLRVPKEALLPILTANPAAAERMAEIMAARRQGLDRAHAEAASEAENRARLQGEAKSILGKIRKFFGI